MAPETDLHCYYGCQTKANIEDDAVVDTQNLCSRAIAQQDTFPCLWLRGILPAGHIVVPPEAEPPLDDVVTYIHEENVYIASGIFFGDASGGEHTRYPEIRRVGCAFASIDGTGQLMFAAHFPSLAQCRL